MARNWRSVITGTLAALTVTLAWAAVATATPVPILGVAAPFLGAIAGGLVSVRLADSRPTRLALVVGAVFGALNGLLLTFLYVLSGPGGSIVPVLAFPIVITVALAATAGGVARLVVRLRGDQAGDGDGEDDEGGGNGDDEGERDLYAPGTGPIGASDRE